MCKCNGLSDCPVRLIRSTTWTSKGEPALSCPRCNVDGGLSCCEDIRHTAVAVLCGRYGQGMRGVHGGHLSIGWQGVQLTQHIARFLQGGAAVCRCCVLGRKAPSGRIRAMLTTVATAGCLNICRRGPQGVLPASRCILDVRRSRLGIAIEAVRCSIGGQIR